MLRDVVEVKPLDGYRLWLRFDDGVQGEVDVSAMVAFKGVFEDLADPLVFASVQVNEELGTVVWPNGADLDPAVLYDRISKAVSSR
jgi:hypothetical protein